MQSRRNGVPPMPACRLATITLLFILTTPVQAAALYKCSDANGLISIQSVPCAKGSTELWKRDANPEPAMTAEQVAAAAMQRQRSAEAARELSLTAGTTRAPASVPATPLPTAAPETDPAQKGPCRRAHDLARDIRALELLELRSDQLYRLEEWVVKQCEPARVGQ